MLEDKDRLGHLTPDEKLAVVAALELMQELFVFLSRHGAAGRDGLIKAALRGALFSIEEDSVDQEKYTDALVNFLVEEFRQDQLKP